MKKKEVRIAVQPTPTKTTKVSDEPAKYKELKVAWQIGLIDFETNWGYRSFTDKISFNFTTEILQSFDNLSEGLYDILTEIDGKEFRNFEALFNAINNKCTIITKDEIKAIISSAKRQYFESKIYPKLKEFERKNWHELEAEKFGKNQKSKHHTIAIGKLCKDAQRRLEVLKMNDIEGLFSLRLEGKLRIFGIRKFNYLQILWVDQEHEVCPADYN